MHTFLPLECGQLTFPTRWCGAAPLHLCILSLRESLWLIQIYQTITFRSSCKIRWVETGPVSEFRVVWCKHPHREQGTPEGLEQVLLQLRASYISLGSFCQAAWQNAGAGSSQGTAQKSYSHTIELENIKLLANGKLLWSHDSWRYLVMNHKDDFDTRGGRCNFPVRPCTMPFLKLCCKLLLYLCCLFPALKEAVLHSTVRPLQRQQGQNGSCSCLQP